MNYTLNVADIVANNEVACAQLAAQNNLPLVGLLTTNTIALKALMAQIEGAKVPAEETTPRPTAVPPPVAAVQDARPAPAREASRPVLNRVSKQAAIIAGLVLLGLGTATAISVSHGPRTAVAGKDAGK